VAQMEAKVVKAGNTLEAAAGGADFNSACLSLFLMRIRCSEARALDDCPTDMGLTWIRI
jgi:hypothetical protein